MTVNCKRQNISSWTQETPHTPEVFGQAVEGRRKKITSFCRHFSLLSSRMPRIVILHPKTVQERELCEPFHSERNQRTVDFCPKNSSSSVDFDFQTDNWKWRGKGICHTLLNQKGKCKWKHKQCKVGKLVLLASNNKHLQIERVREWMDSKTTGLPLPSYSHINNAWRISQPTWIHVTCW